MGKVTSKKAKMQIKKAIKRDCRPIKTARKAEKARVCKKSTDKKSYTGIMK